LDLKEKFAKEVLKIKGSHKFQTSRAELLGFWFEGIEGEALALLLQNDGIKASTESPCLKKYTPETGLSHEQAHSSLTIAWSNRFKEKDVKAIITSLKKHLKKLRSISATW
jgi:cysteine sulfinate desulfinase/cysteine desulfurase-like protein